MRTMCVGNGAVDAVVRKEKTWKITRMYLDVVKVDMQEVGPREDEVFN